MAQPSSPRRCRDCRFFGYEDSKAAMEICTHPSFAKFSPIGDPEPVWARDARSSGLCGPEASQFEPLLSSPQTRTWKEFLFG